MPPPIAAVSLATGTATAAGTATEALSQHTAAAEEARGEAAARLSRLLSTPPARAPSSAAGRDTPPPRAPAPAPAAIDRLGPQPETSGSAPAPILGSAKKPAGPPLVRATPLAEAPLMQ